MSVIVYFGDASAYVSAASGLAGALIGGAIAGTVSLKIAREARDAAERAWVRDSRREIYDRFLAAGQKLLALMEGTTAATEARPESRAAVDAAYAAFFETYASVQTVAELSVVTTAREQAYLLQGLKDILDGSGPQKPGDFDRIAQSVRLARQDTIDAMRADLGLRGSAKPPADYNYAVAVIEAARKGQRPPRE